MLTYSISGFITLTLAVITASIGNAAQTASYTPPPFSHFEPILERMPFGELPDKFGESVDPDAAKQEALLKAQQQILARKINMSAVNITPQGSTAIGFTDLSAKPPVNYYLLVGTEAGGWKVNSANYDEETAEIEKDGVAISLQLGKGLVDKTPGPAPATKSSVSKSALAALKNTPQVSAKPAPLAPPGEKTAAPSAASIRDQLRKIQVPQQSSDVRSYMERLRERKIEQSKALLHAETTQRKQLESLAREVASKEIEKQAALAEEAALEKELIKEEERLQKQAEEEEEKPAL